MDKGTKDSVTEANTQRSLRLYEALRTPSQYHNNPSMWFHISEGVHLSDHTLTLKAPNRFTEEWYRTKLKEHISLRIREQGITDIKIVYLVDPSIQPAPSQSSQTETPQKSTGRLYVLENAKDTIRAEVKFSHLVSTPPYTLPVMMMQSIHQRLVKGEPPPNTGYFLIGDSGAGKTTLAEALANECIASQIPVGYLNVNSLSVVLQGAYDKRHPWPSFDRFRQAKLIIIDNAHSLKGRPGCQERILRVIDAGRGGTYFIFAGQESPEEVAAYLRKVVPEGEESSSSRLALADRVGSTIPVAINQIGRERKEFIRGLFLKKGIPSSPQLEELILTMERALPPDTSARTYTGKVDAIISYANLLATTPSRSLAIETRLLPAQKELFDTSSSAESIINAVLAMRRVPREELFHGRNSHANTQLRREVAYALCLGYGLSYDSVAKLLHKERTAVHSWMRAAKKEFSPDLRDELLKIAAAVK